MIRFRPALLLAVAATGTAICMSILAGWQRGGLTAERFVWIATGIVLVACAHLLPAICRSAPAVLRGVGTILWLGCMATTSYGHATFFLLSQSHAGKMREQSILVGRPQTHRSLTVVMKERATVTAELAATVARHCVRDCSSVRSRRVTLTARLDAIDAEASEVRRLQRIDDREAALHDAARDDPVTARLAALCGVSGSKLDLFAGLTFAAVLEGVGCLLWWVESMPRAGSIRVEIDSEVVAPLMSAQARDLPAAAEQETELDRLTRDIEAGLLRPTVSGIRKHLNCSQTRAVSLRRQLAEATA